MSLAKFRKITKGNIKPKRKPNGQEEDNTLSVASKGKKKK